MSTTKNVVIVAILLGTAYLAYVNRERLLGVLRANPDRKPRKRENKRGDAMVEVCQAFLVYADNFQGLYEPLYKASVGAISIERMKNVLMEWNIRMKNISQAPICLKSWWSTIMADYDNLIEKELQERSRQIVQMILSSGIVRDNKTELVVTDSTGLYYQLSDGKELASEQEMLIESPCWYLPISPVRIVEKGYCRTK